MTFNWLAWIYPQQFQLALSVLEQAAGETQTADGCFGYACGLVGLTSFIGCALCEPRGSA